MASKIVECTFGSVDVRGPNYSGPRKVTSDLMDIKSKEVENEEPVVTEGEEQEPTEPSKPVSHSLCASVKVPSFSYSVNLTLFGFLQ